MSSKMESVVIVLVASVLVLVALNNVTTREGNMSGQAFSASSADTLRSFEASGNEFSEVKADLIALLTSERATLPDDVYKQAVEKINALSFSDITSKRKLYDEYEEKIFLSGSASSEKITLQVKVSTT
ncbi:MAG: hypothetical protein H6502_02805 [Candidatus Woesearchaeota archaeon]|nr:MAG: hypothetical protein H6502_02805 [Candidatus Woesearchaeota archaeon]